MVPLHQGSRTMSDWDLIGGDPAPGDPGLIRLLAGDLATTATGAQDARVALSSIGGEVVASGWKGEAAEKFEQAFTPIAPDLGAMAESYDRAADALRTYATELNEIQAEVRYALNRARLAKQRQDLTGPRLDAARATVSSLTRQLSLVATEQKLMTVQAPLYASNPVTAAQHAQDLQRLRSTYRAVQQSLDGARSQQRALQGELDGARADLGAAHRQADDLRERRRSAERTAANAIHDALAHSIKNKSNFDRVAHWAQHQLHDLGHALGNLREEIYEVAVKLHKVLDVLEKIATIALFVIAVVGLFVPVVGGPLLLGILLAISAGKLLTTATALATGTDAEKKRDHVTVGRLVSEGFDTLANAFAFSDARAAMQGATKLGGLVGEQESGLYKFMHDPREYLSDATSMIRDPSSYLDDRTTTLAYCKRALYADGRDARGWMRAINIAEPGARATPVVRLVAAGRVVDGVHDDVNRVNDVYKGVKKGIDEVTDVDSGLHIAARDAMRGATEIFQYTAGHPVVGPLGAPVRVP